MDIHSSKADFPVLQREIRPGIPLTYLDSAATSQKPVQVIQAMSHYYQYYNANIHRGVHTLAEEATAAYELARKKIAAFVHAEKSAEIIFTRNATESINLVAHSWGRSNLKKGDVILLTEMEHHSNLVPWQMLAAEKELQLEFVPVDSDGVLDREAYQQLLSLQPKLVAFTHMSNVLGTVNPVKAMTQSAHQAGALVLVDCAQSVPHMTVDVQDLDVDFLAFSAHKMLGPTGIGALFGKQALLAAMPPFLGGGDMIKQVKLRSFTANELPHKFEAGTPAIAEGIGFGAAIDYLSALGMENVHKHEAALIQHVLERMEEIPGVKVIGPTADKKGAVAAFVVDGVHPHDVAQILDYDGIAVRAGHHCAMPLHEKFGLPATSRASFYIYNDFEDVEKLVQGIWKVKKTFGG